VRLVACSWLAFEVIAGGLHLVRGRRLTRHCTGALLIVAPGELYALGDLVGGI
jgi:hypothetical protein